MNPDTSILEQPGVSATTVVRCLLAAIAIGALYSGIVLYAHDTYDTMKPLYVVLLLVAGAVAVLAFEPHRSMRALRSPVLMWAYLYLLVSTASGIWRTTFSARTDQMLVDRYRSMAFLFAMLVVFEDRAARKLARVGVLLVAAASSVVNVLQALGLVTFTVARFEGRAAGLYVNPNQAGFVIVFGMAVGMTAVPRAWRVPALLLGSVGVAATFSRSAMLCLFALAVVLAWQRHIPRWPAVVGVVAAAVAVAWNAPRLMGLLDASGTLNQDTLGRLTMTAGDSGRTALAKKSWRLFLDSPWVGHGIGTERDGRVSHNMYISLAAEHGIAGLVAFPAFVASFLFRNRAAAPLAVALLVAAFFSHNILEEEQALLCVALSAWKPADAPRTGDDSPAVYDGAGDDLTDAEA